MLTGAYQKKEALRVWDFADSKKPATTLSHTLEESWVYCCTCFSSFRLFFISSSSSEILSQNQHVHIHIYGALPSPDLNVSCFFFWKEKKKKRNWHAHFWCLTQCYRQVCDWIVRNGWAGGYARKRSPADCYRHKSNNRPLPGRPCTLRNGF